MHHRGDSLISSRRRLILARISWLLALSILINYLHWDFIDFSFIPNSIPKAEAQAATQSTFYFKADSVVTPTRTANNYFGVAGPTVENSSDASGMVVSGQATALGMIPIAGPIQPNATSLSINAYRVTSAAFTNTPDVDMAWFRTFIMPLGNNTTFTSDTSFTVGMSASESHGALNGYLRAYVYVYDSNDNNSAKVLAGPTSHPTNELTTSLTGYVWPVTNAVGGSSYSSNNYDYLAVEFWVDATTRTSNARTVTLCWGGNGAITDRSITNAGNAASYITVNTTTVDTFDPIYLQPTSTDRAPIPNAHQGADSFRSSTMDSRRMSTVAGAGAESNTQAVETTGNPYYYQMNIWCSPPLAAQTIPAGNWIFHLHGNESTLGNNAAPRTMIYTWDADDTIGDTIYARANGNEFNSTTTDNQLEAVLAGSAATITAGERVCLDVELVSLAAITASNVIFRFGSATAPSTTTYDSAIIPPMDSASTPTPLQYQAVSYQQTHFQFDTDDDDETHIAWTDKAGATTEDDTTVLYDVSTNYRVRIQFRNDGGETGTFSPLLYYSTSEGGTYTQVTNTTTDVKIVTSALVTHNEATTRQLTDETANGWDFAVGRVVETSDIATSLVALTAWSFTEYEWSIYSATVNTYYLRAYASTTAFTAYTKTAAVEIQGPQLGLTAPADIVLNDGNRGFTVETTFAADELVTATDAGAGWSLTVSSSAITGAPTTYVISAANVKLRTDGTVGGGGDTKTIWSGTTSNVTEPAANTYALDTPQTVGTRSSGSVGDETNVRPTIQIDIPAGAEVENYTGTLTFTIA
ncbi:hypothetical protein A2994_03000 [candidate division Kazan bacterium RIFCSPLOWO2_01_FULL_48_13]|uniref:Uncharacterized protein n=1 Tax=candidate division Kazan bacterium RIFCSPLOWO2_01_FULL_48_13 TaxID=1798539 RepID=A0A1F4PPT7_UNCK3|nr:MAG: hypothetical protein A2994_03000 [candidate division Kazan bacterium RIFCSPLOWO2_01_FULL_48_13]